jgi:hypothetical protein
MGSLLRFYSDTEAVCENPSVPGRRAFIALLALLAATPAAAQEHSFDEPEEQLPPDAVMPLRFKEFYQGSNTTYALRLSDKLLNADGRRVRINGFMAPPLKPALDFFVLTRTRLEACPFCSSMADWPADILLVTMPRGESIELTYEPIQVVGRLEVGEAVDPETGFFSLLRLRAESVAPLPAG